VAYCRINDRGIYYETHGEGTPLVLLHHGFGCTLMWKDIYPAFQSKGFQIWMYDRRGYGRSHPGSDFESFYVSDRFRPESVEELHAFTQMFGLEAFHLIGQCEGGVVAVDYAVAYPHRVKTITVSSTQCFSPCAMPEFNRMKFPVPFQGLDAGLKNKLLYWHGPEHAERFYNLFRKFGGAYGTGFFDLRDRLSKVPCPTLVLYPDRSGLFDVEQAVSFYRHLPEGELAVLPRCGHNTYEHQPEDYIRIVGRFLARHA